MLLMNQSSTINMGKRDMLVSYLTKVIELKDQLPTIGKNVEDKELVSIPLNTLFSYWMPFSQRVCARENFKICKALG
jgi:hypothetical protein